jgi:transcriptional regulator with GAF, ATPase, and Fis domain
MIEAGGRAVARSRASVALGETGTGKELIAYAITTSQRRNRPFVRVTALSESLSKASSFNVRARSPRH